MKSFEETIQNVKHSAMNDVVNAIGKPEAIAQGNSLEAEKVFLMLQDIGKRAKAADGDLNVKVVAGTSPSLIVGFLDAHFSTPQYIVKTTIENGKIDVKVTDGKWVQKPHYLGLWGNWIDEETVYSGDFQDNPIRQGIEASLLAWYEGVKMNHQQGAPLH